MEPPRDTLGEDDIIWGPDPQGNFTLKTAYEILASVDHHTDQDIWKTVWRWAGPNRVRHFLWLVAHNRILTNAERRRRHRVDVAECQRCRSGIEDTLHVVRDCQLAREVWASFITPELTSHFFSDSLQDWLKAGLTHKGFELTFGIIIWILWKARNEAIFEDKPATSDQLRLRVLHWIAGVRETMRADSQVTSKGGSRRIDTHIGWRAGRSDGITINTDGSVLQPHSRAAAGGIIRDWEVTISHTFREGNRVADLLAHHGHSLDLGFHVDCLYPHEVDRAIWDDHVGTCFPRTIPIND
ncbi:Putative ribonuclease H protein At1g65750 [Linum perenne]